ncbi:MAG TPA: hypothetical protein VMT34_07170 [Aggregatilineales bacterium]|nr:hypothetical protein [Aggregatilineales bacterium]
MYLSRWGKRLLIPLIVMLAAFLPHPALSLAAPGLFDVLVNSSMNKNKPGLFFVDARTGLSSIVITNGTQHTLLEKGVLFQELGTGAVKIAYADGTIVPFDAIPAPGENTRVQWVISPNRHWLLWVSSRTDNTTLSSDLYITALDNPTPRLILHASSTKGIETLPLAVADDGQTAYYTRLALAPKAYRLFTVAGDVFSLDVPSGKTTQLPADSPCACAVMPSADRRLFARLETNAAQGGFDLRLYDLSGSTNALFKSPGAAAPQTQAGNLLISPDGAYIAYVSARGTPLTRFSPPEQYAVTLVDVKRKVQRTLDTGLQVNLQPMSFSDDNTLLIAVGTDKDGTFKISLKDGTILQSSAYTYLGTVSG